MELQSPRADKSHDDGSVEEIRCHRTTISHAFGSAIPHR